MNLDVLVFTYRLPFAAGLVAAVGGLWTPALLLWVRGVEGPARDFVGGSYMLIAAVLIVMPCGVACAVWQRRSTSRGQALVAGLAGVGIGVGLWAATLGLAEVASLTRSESAVGALVTWALSALLYAVLLSLPFAAGWGAAMAIMAPRQPGGSADALRCRACSTQLYGPWFDRKAGGYVCRRCGALTPTAGPGVGPGTSSGAS